MALAPFDPVKNAFKYKNGEFKFKVGPTTWSILCGGMSYAALDYYYMGLRVPESGAIPVEGNPMETYLYRRQATAHYYTWHRFTNAWTLSNVPIISAITDAQDSIHKLAEHLATRPVILCLYGVFCGHHVVASSCDVGKQSITLYDSNFPGRSSSIEKTKDGWLHQPSNTVWSGWFMDWGHHTDGVKRPPLAWRYCRRCHGLNTNGFGSPGECINGVPHDNNPNLEYFLPWTLNDGQRGWYACSKCMGLFRQSDTTAVPFCPAGGMHLVKPFGSKNYDLGVMTDGAGETGWRRCNYCTSLFWMNAANRGQCPTGGQHDPDNSGHFVVDNRTLS